MKHLKKFNEANNDNYWSLYSEIKHNVTLCLVDLMDAGMRCEPDATNLYRIELRIDPMYGQIIKIDDVRESISWFLEVNQIAITKYNYTAKTSIRLIINGKADLKFDSSELDSKEVNDNIAFIEIKTTLTKV
jgi:hypothetical protein